MTSEPVDNVYGMTMTEWISLVPNELAQDAVGLWQIVPAGILRFGLSGGELEDYVRRNIEALLNAGAVPVVGSIKSDYEWIRQTQLGISREEIVAAVIAEWHRVGNDPGELAGSIWFARPVLGKMYVKMD